MAYFYLSTTLFIGAVPSIIDIINVIDIAYVLMALPTMLSIIILAPHVMKEVKSYFKRLEEKL